MQIKLSDRPTTAYISKCLDSAKDDIELVAMIEEIDRQGKSICGQGFRLRLDQSSLSRNVRNRVLITIPGIQRHC